LNLERELEESNTAAQDDLREMQSKSEESLA